MRTCYVCLGEGTIVSPVDPGDILTCFACVGKKQVADPDFDALVEQVEVLEKRCDALAARPIGGSGSPC